MSPEEFPSVHISVALILDESKQKFLWTWNARWRAFCLPMSKVAPWRGIRASQNPAAAREAAERAAAEALGVPVEVHHPRRLSPILERSGRDGRLKSYVYEAFRAGAHPQFAGRVSLFRPHIWLAGHESQSGEFRPLAAASLRVIDQLVEAGLVPGRQQLATTLLVSRETGDVTEYLMRPNPKWGYFFPSKRRRDGESAAAAGERVAREELGLDPTSTVTLRPVSHRPLTYHDQSDSAETATFYVHSVYTATLNDGARLDASGGLVWVPLADIVAGQSAAPKTLSGAAGQPGTVSRTALRMLEFARHC